MLAEGGLGACGEDFRTITNRQHDYANFTVKGKPKRWSVLYILNLIIAVNKQKKEKGEK